jgi:hypothetical protein
VLLYVLKGVLNSLELVVLSKKRTICNDDSRLSA